MEILRRMLPGGRLRVAAVAALACAVGVPRARPEVSREYELKGVLLFNLTQFVDWPPSAFGGPDEPFVIGIFGRDPFGPGLDQVVRDERAGGRRIVVKRMRDPVEARSCELLFVSASERVEMPQLLRVTGGRPLLTVSDCDGFLRRGGIVEFYRTPENKIRLRVNMEAARAARLTISSKLLRVAEVRRAEED